MTDRKFEIGEVIYLVSTKPIAKKGSSFANFVVFPGIVNEEMVHRTREGDSISYKIMVGDASKNKIIDMAKVAGEIFGSLEEIKKVMQERANEQINHTLSNAALLAKRWYNAETDTFINEGTDGLMEDEKIDPAAILNEVSNPRPNHNPQYVQIDHQRNRAIPYNQMEGERYYDPRDSRNNLRNQMAEPELRERMIQMPDGSYRKVVVGG